MNDQENEKKVNIEKEELTPDDKQEMDLFVKNSQKYCQKIYGQTFCDEELEELRKEIRETNEAAKKIKKEWGLA